MQKIARSKKNASITVHIPQAVKDRLLGLAEQQRPGQGSSEYVYETLIIPHLVQIESETKIRQKIFELTGNESVDEQHSERNKLSAQ